MEGTINETPRRRCTPKALKFEILKEHREHRVPISVLARRHGIHPITVYQWKRAHMTEDQSELSPEKMRSLLLENQTLKQQVKALKEKVGDLCISNEILETALEIAKKKALLKEVNSAGNSKPLKNSKL